MSQTIQCPNCGYEIAIDKALSHRLEEKLREEMNLKYKREIEAKQKEMEEKAKKEAENEKQKLEEERKNLRESVQKEMKEKQSEELQAMQKKMQEMEDARKAEQKRLEEMQKSEMELRKQKQELEVAHKNMEFEMQRKLDEERKKQMEQVQKQYDEYLRNKELSYKEMMAQKDKQMTDLQKALEEAQKKGSQTSQQLQGDVQEISLKEHLQESFPNDTVEDVKTGMRGADLLQTVYTPQGKKVGVIIWESKNTKSFVENWIDKLKDDKADAKADISVLVSKALPQNVEHFGEYRDVWITAYPYAVMLASALRTQLISVDAQREASAGKDEKMNHLYTYLSGPQFKNRVEGMVSAFLNMQTQLDSEKRAFQKQWARREKEIERMMNSTVGMYGDMQGIIGNNLPSIESLEMNGFLETGNEESSSSYQGTSNSKDENSASLF